MSKYILLLFAVSVVAVLSFVGRNHCYYPDLAIDKIDDVYGLSLSDLYSRNRFSSGKFREEDGLVAIQFAVQPKELPALIGQLPSGSSLMEVEGYWADSKRNEDWWFGDKGYNQKFTIVAVPFRKKPIVGEMYLTVANLSEEELIVNILAAWDTSHAQ